MDEETSQPSSENQGNQQQVQQDPLPSERVVIIEREMQVKNDTGDIVIKQGTTKEGKK